MGLLARERDFTESDGVTGVARGMMRGETPVGMISEGPYVG